MKFIYNHIEIDYSVSAANCQIKDSFKIKSKAYIKAFLKYLKLVYPQFCKRTDKSYIREWKAHTFFYSLNLFKERTKDTDLNINEYWYRRLIYFIVSPFVKLSK